METLITKPKASFPGYQIGKLLYKSSRSLYFIGQDLDQHQKVLIRFLKKKQLSDTDISGFQSEYELMRELSDIDGVPFPLQMKTTAYGPAMILKFFEGCLLSDIIKKTSPDSSPQTIMTLTMTLQNPVPMIPRMIPLNTFFPLASP